MSWYKLQSSKFSFPLNPFNYPIIPSIRDFLRANYLSDRNILHFGAGKNKLDWNPKNYLTVDIDPEAGADYKLLGNIPADIKVDVVYSEGCIEHLTVEEIKLFFNWCHSKNATIIFNVPNAWASYGVYASDFTHKTFLNTRAYGGLLFEAGYSRIEFYRVHSGRFHFIRGILTKLMGVDFCETIVVRAIR